MAGYVRKFFVAMLIVLPFYLLVRRPWRTWSKREAALAVFVLFVTGTVLLTMEGDYAAPGVLLERAVTRLKTGDRINLVPFRSIRSWFGYTFPMVNFLGNILMFMPWGFGLPLLWKRRQGTLSLICCSLALTLSIEAVQLFIGRSVDVDDVILNFSGSCLGAGLYFLLRRIFPKLSEFAR